MPTDLKADIFTPRQKREELNNPMAGAFRVMGFGAGVIKRFSAGVVKGSVRVSSRGSVRVSSRGQCGCHQGGSAGVIKRFSAGVVKGSVRVSSRGQCGCRQGVSAGVIKRFSAGVVNTPLTLGSSAFPTTAPTANSTANEPFHTQPFITGTISPTLYDTVNHSPHSKLH